MIIKKTSKKDTSNTTSKTTSKTTRKKCKRTTNLIKLIKATTNACVKISKLTKATVLPFIFVVSLLILLHKANILNVSFNTQRINI